MRRLETYVDKASPTYRAYRERNLELAADLRSKLHAARYERPQRALARLAEQDKLAVRERLALLLDRGTPFLELMSLAANRHYDGEAPQALLVTGVGSVNGREVMVIANDSSLKGGAWYPITTRKIVRALEIALENRLPVIHMLDSGGANLHLQDEIYAWAGHIFKQQCQLSARGIPQLAVVFGYCTAGAAYTPTLSDQTIMVRGRGAIFLAGPPLVRAATGELVTTEDLGGADMHTSVSGVADYAVDSEAEALTLAREVVGVWGRREKADTDRRVPEPPFHDPNDLYGIIPDDVKKQFEMREVIARIIDGSMFHEFKPDYGDTMVTGWAFIWGMKVGILGNNGVIYSEAANKATTFMELCDRDGIPLLFLQNVTGFMVGREYERRGITKDGAKMLMVQANVTVPKLTVLCHASQGAGNYAMAGRNWDPRLLFAWPNSRSSIMGPEVAADTLTHVRVTALKRQGKDPSPEEIARIRADVIAHFEETYHSYYLTSDLRDDGLIDPVDTRNALGMSLSVVLNAPIVRAPGGVLRI